MTNSKKRKKQPKNSIKAEVAKTKEVSKPKVEVRTVSDSHEDNEVTETSVKNLLIIVGIIILLIVALVLAGLFVSNLANQNTASNESSATSTESSTSQARQHLV
jgi:cytoskeletal protein RodZ